MALSNVLAEQRLGKPDGWWPHLLARHDVVLEVLHQLGALVLVQQVVPLLPRQCCHGPICGQEEGERPVDIPVQQLGHARALQKQTRTHRHFKDCSKVALSLNQSVSWAVSPRGGGRTLHSRDAGPRRLGSAADKRTHIGTHHLEAGETEIMFSQVGGVLTVTLSSLLSPVTSGGRSNRSIS